ncbi:MAG: leucine-rich repeat protein [Lachnospiraceae bacterium]|nr:leucine-rich repeat protein [Lachnospiraceae bacterium]
MRAVRKKWMACLLALILAFGSVSGSIGYTAVSRAAESQRYVIYLDGKEFEVSAQDYMTIYYLRNDKTALTEYLRMVLGERMPDSFQSIGGKILTTDSIEGELFPAESGEDARPEFLISDKKLLAYNGTAQVVTVPDTVTEIHSMAFHGNSYVKAVILPESVTKINRYAFYDCPALTYIVFPKSVSSLGKNIIMECKKLTNIVAPEGSKAYTYAVDNDIPVTTGLGIRFRNKKCYLLEGDSEKNPLLNCLGKAVWKSSKKKVATISASGKISAKKTGKTVITATVDGTVYTCQVIVWKKTMDRRVSQIIKSSVTKDMSRYEKIKAVHNWFVRNVKYDYYRYQLGRVPAVSHTAKGALLKKLAVCDGYSYAFQMVMSKLKIPCRFVVGRSGGVGHGWNMVKLGGKWYHIDVTFDDPIVNDSNENTTPYYTYFLKSSSVMKKDHKWKKSKYPKCNSKKYNFIK